MTNEAHPITVEVVRNAIVPMRTKWRMRSRRPLQHDDL